jgi:hypothetical protein
MSYPILGYCAIVSYSIPIAIAIAKYKFLNREFTTVLYLLLIGCVTDVLSLWQYFGTKVAPWLVHVYILIELFLVMSILWSWQKSIRMKRAFMILTGLYVIIWLTAKVTFEPFGGVYTFTGSVSNVMLTLCAGFTFFLVFESVKQPIMSNDRFWILLSMLFNYAGSLLPLAFLGVVFTHSRENVFTMWSIMWVLATISHLLYAIGFFYTKKETVF